MIIPDRQAVKAKKGGKCAAGDVCGARDGWSFDMALHEGRQKRGQSDVMTGSPSPLNRSMTAKLVIPFLENSSI
jgi:hypothetical protein